MINYIIQVLLFQTLFLAVYGLLLKKETFFQWNRLYLIVTSILAYVIPFIKINRVTNYVQEAFIVPEIFINPESFFLNEVSINQQTSIFTLENLYILGLVLMTFLFLYKISKIIRKIRNNQVIKKPNHQLVILKKENSAFSFFNYIFLGEFVYEKDHQEVLKHELIHVKQKHTLDLLFFEIQKIVFWMNPFSYLFQSRISTLHEYIADAKTIQIEDKTSFFENLLNQTFNVEKITFVNNYYKQSLLKKRIIMATKNKSKQILKMKYLLVLPLIFTMLVITSCNAQVKSVTNSNEVKPPPPPSSKKVINVIPPPPPPFEIFENKHETEKYDFFSLEKTPVFPGCEEFTTSKGLRNCFNKSINNHIQENFNAKLANTLGLSTGRKRIAIQFVIGKDGTIGNIKTRAPHQKLEEEAKRVIKLLLIMQAGEIDGKKVAVSYTLPINFMVKE